MILTLKNTYMFDKKAHIERMKKPADKLIQYFAQKGISFSPVDGETDNVIFSQGDKKVKISHHSFYRFSGIACVYEHNDTNNTVKILRVSDSMFMEMYMKPIVELLISKA